MTSEQTTNHNNIDLADQSLSSESIANEIQSPSLISNNTSANSRNNNKKAPPLVPNNAEEQQIQPQSDPDQHNDQIIEEEVPQSQNALVRFMKSAGSAVYNAMYNAGGFLADLFGITTPRYAYAIHEYEKYQERLRQRQLEKENEANGEELDDVENPNNSPEPDQAL